MTHYETLGVSENATQEEIKSAYKDLIKKYHPDIYQGDKIFAEKKTKEINVAYDILSNPEARKNYDEELHPQPTYTESNYDYTPPQYNNSNTYKKYYENYKNNYSNDYFRRYTDYHRSKTPNSNYYTNNRNNTSFIHEKIKYIVIILIIYLFVLTFTYIQISSLLKGDTNNKTIINTNKQDSSNYINVTIPSYTDLDEEDDDDLDEDWNEDFDINDYFSDEELYNAYQNYFTDYFDNYSEFKDFFEDYMYEEYFE